MHSGNLNRFKTHPEFNAARLAAPHLLKDMGDTVADLEAQIKELKSQ